MGEGSSAGLVTTVIKMIDFVGCLGLCVLRVVFNKRIEV